MERRIKLYTPKSLHPEELYDHKMAAYLAGISIRTLLRYWKHGIVKPFNNNIERYGIYFDEEAICKLRQAEQLRQQHGINLTGIRMILELNQQVENLSQELYFWRNLV